MRLRKYSGNKTIDLFKNKPEGVFLWKGSTNLYLGPNDLENMLVFVKHENQYQHTCNIKKISMQKELVNLTVIS